MKKISVLALACLVFSFNLSAQCVATDDFTSGTLELSSTAMTPVYACADCGDHVRVLSLQTFADTTLSVVVDTSQPALEVTVFADRFRLDSIGGLPAGLTYTTNSAFDTTYDAVDNPFGYWINLGDTVLGFENTIGCISIEGSAADWTAAAGGGPNSDGAYPLTVYVDARAADFLPVEIADVVGYNTWLTDMGFLLDAFGDPNFTDNGIRLENAAVLQVYASGVGVEEIKVDKSELIVYPNPSNGVIEITYHSEETSENTEIRLYDMDGKLVKAISSKSAFGTNTHSINLSEVTVGVYSISINTESFSIRQRVVVQ